MGVSRCFCFATCKASSNSHMVRTVPKPLDATYHGLLSESTDLLDGAGSPLLEGNAVDLFTASALCSPSVFRPMPAQPGQTLKPA